jgi:hypothetical protein
MTKLIKATTSLKLRQAAMLAAEAFRRPITAHEVETWLANHDPDLWQEVAEKCHDYVRIILSLTPDDSVVKYKCRSHFPGADRRACFYGTCRGPYDPAIWQPIRKGGKNHLRQPPDAFAPFVPTSPGGDDPPASDASFFFPDRVILPFEDDVTPETCERAWFALTTLIPSCLPFWGDFRRAAETMKARIEQGMQPDVIVRQLLEENPSLTHPLVAADAVHILSRQAILKIRDSSPSDDLEPQSIPVV